MGGPKISVVRSNVPYWKVPRLECSASARMEGIAVKGSAIGRFRNWKVTHLEARPNDETSGMILPFKASVLDAHCGLQECSPSVKPCGSCRYTDSTSVELRGDQVCHLPIAEPSNCGPSNCGTFQVRNLSIAEPCTCGTFQSRNLQIWYVPR